MAALVGVVLTGCSASAASEPDAVPVAPTPSGTPSDPAPAPAPTVLSRLTGMPVADGPALAVKIDNTSAARPRVGLEAADVVYVLPVEGGLTRLLAVFSTRMPDEVGPVRSARESDGRILEGWGGVAFADSGASRHTNAQLRGADFERVSLDTSGDGFHRDRGRKAPYDVVGDPARLIARAGGSATPPDLGLAFGPAPGGGTPAAHVAVRYPSSRVEFDWSPTERRWLLSTDGNPDVSPGGTRHGAATVVVQRVKVASSANRDVNGAATPVVTMTGSGEATVLRDGASFEASWSRTDGEAATTFTTGTDPAPMTFAPGPVWVVLVSSGQSVTVD